MAIRTVLACICSGESGENVLEAAWRVASPFDAHIEALHVRADPRGLVPYTGEGMDGSMIEDLVEAPGEGVGNALASRMEPPVDTKKKDQPGGAPA